MIVSFKKHLAFCVMVLALISIVPASANAWGAAGHRIVAIIASRHLKTNARKMVAQLLGEDVTMASVANYADAVRDFRPETARFHFVDIPLDKNDYDEARDCEQIEGEGDCAIAAIARFATVLKNPNETVGRRRFALKFLIHLIGDLHQPLHSANNNDRGGNKVKITWFGRSGKGMNLHAVWDKLIIQHAELDDSEFADELEDGLTAQKIAAMQTGNATSWALEAHRAAQNHAYKLPTNKKLDDDYYDKNFAVVDEQLLRAGLRLASALNKMFP